MSHLFLILSRASIFNPNQKIIFRPASGPALATRQSEPAAGIVTRH
jgi:hypothetical protein